MGPITVILPPKVLYLHDAAEVGNGSGSTSKDRSSGLASGSHWTILGCCFSSLALGRMYSASATTFCSASAHPRQMKLLAIFLLYFVHDTT